MKVYIKFSVKESTYSPFPQQCLVTFRKDLKRVNNENLQQTWSPFLVPKNGDLQNSFQHFSIPIGKYFVYTLIRILEYPLLEVYLLDIHLQYVYLLDLHTVVSIYLLDFYFSFKMQMLCLKYFEVLVDHFELNNWSTIRYWLIERNRHKMIPVYLMFQIIFQIWNPSLAKSFSNLRFIFFKNEMNFKFMNDDRQSLNAMEYESMIRFIAKIEVFCLTF